MAEETWTSYGTSPLSDGPPFKEVGKRAVDQIILRLLVQHAVPDQAKLLGLLAEEGFKLTQGTLSRRLARLSVRKRSGRYQRVAGNVHVAPPYSMVQSVPNLLVLRTHQGLAQELAVRVDPDQVRGIAGTVAGDDTLFIAIRSEASLQEVQAQVEQLLGPPQLRL